MINQSVWSFFSDHWNSHAGDSNVLLWRHNSVSKPYVDVLIHGLAFYWPVVSTETWRWSLRTLNRVDYRWISCDVTRLRHIPWTQCHLTQWEWRLVYATWTKIMTGMQRRKEKAQKNSGEHLVLLQKKITGSLDCQRGCNQKLLNNYIYSLK